MADGRTAMVKCKIMKLGDLNYKSGTCPHRIVKHYEQSFMDVMRLVYAKQYKGVTPGEVKRWDQDPDDCPCVACVRVRFFLDNLEHILGPSPKMGG